MPITAKTRRTEQFACDECPAMVANDDIDALIPDTEGRLERVLCARCRPRFGVPERSQ